MNIAQAITDRVEIEALRAEFTDAGLMHDDERFASLFSPDGVWRMPHVPLEFVGRKNIRAGVEHGQSLWQFFIQTIHPGVILLDGVAASGRCYVAEFGRLRDDSSHANHGIYHDRYARTPEGWKFAERIYEVRYFDTTPLTGAPPNPIRA
nr:nuclear transport factor 2 family protein [Microbacterium bovistercoris]